MTYTVTKLITNAFHNSGIVAREFSSVSGDQIGVGLDELNKLLAMKTVRQSLIPYYTTSTFTAVVGQEEYTVAGLISLSTLTFNIGTVRFAVEEKNLFRYQGTPRANNVTSLPYQYHLEPQLSGAKIFLYFKPTDTYTFTMWGKFRLASVTLNQDLELTTELFYINYLEWELAELLCKKYSLAVPSEVSSELNKLRDELKDMVGPLDLQARKRSTLMNRSTGDIYAQANLGKGWTR